VRLPGAQVTFTTRQGGVSEGPYDSLNLGILTADDPERVTENRRRAAGQAGVEAERMAMGWQVHGTDLKEWTGPPPDRAYAQPGDKDLEKVDGHLTRESGIGLLVLVADCYPVALSDGEQVAMLHCGWRPLAGGIIDKAVSRFTGVPAAAVGGARGLLGPWGGCVRAHARSAGRDCCAARRGRCHRRGARGPLHELLARPVLLTPPRRRRHWPPGGHHRARWILNG
jgi:polyphenol oxidase